MPVLRIGKDFATSNAGLVDPIIYDMPRTAVLCGAEKLQIPHGVSTMMAGGVGSSAP
jgi:hypothetical protein